MSTIFISHSSKNKDLAIEVYQRLHTQGYQSVFLDVDRADGIIAGEKWEEVLYRELRTCQVLIALVSDDWLASGWCFAELSHAREKGKTVIGLQLTPHIDPSILRDTQLIRFTPEVRDDSYERLWEGLRSALDIRGFHQWDAARSPYPGLSTFDEDDAAVFFGRDATVRELKEKLLAIRRDPSTNKRLVLVLGASGCGKSSLVRGGIVPLLKKHDHDKDSWLVLAPFRPGTHPLNELAKAYAQALKDYGDSRDWDAIRELFQRALAPSNSEILHDLGEDLRMRAQRPQATLLIIVDQVEELLGQDGPEQHARFFVLLRQMIESHGHGILVVGTLRSDFLGAFQSQERAGHIPYEPFHLESAELDFRAVIGGPAHVAHIELEDGLIDMMVADTRTKDALPLLAFALRELWERYGSDKRLTLDEYQQGLSGLEGALDRKAEEVYAASAMTSAQEQQFRQVLRAMVRVDDEGRYLRKPVPRADLPHDIDTLLERFVTARLLVADTEQGKPILEVAHEALFPGWQRLKTWLDDDREFLLWHQRLHSELKKWESTNHHDGTLLRGPLLAEAELWLAKQPADLTPDERGFMQASVALRQREQAARERRRNLTLASAIVGAMLMALLGIFGLHNAREAQEQATLARARLLVTQGQAVFESAPLLGLRLALEGFALVPPADAKARALIVDSIRDLAKLGRRFTLGSDVEEVHLSPDGSRFVVDHADAPGELRRTIDGTLVVPLTDKVKSGGNYGVRFSPDPAATYFVVRYSDEPSELRRTAGGSVLVRLSGKTEHLRTSFSPDPSATYVMVSYDSGAPELRRSADGTIVPLTDAVSRVYFSQDPAAYSFVVDYAGTPGELRRTADGTLVATLAGRVANDGVHFSPDPAATHFVVAYQNMLGELRRTADGTVVTPLSGPVRFQGVSFSPDLAGTYFVVGYDRGPNELRRTSNGTIIRTLRDNGYRVSFSRNPGTTYFVVHYSGSGTELYRTADGTSVPLTDKIDEVYFSRHPTTPHFVVSYTRAPGELRRITDGALVTLLKDKVVSVHFSPDLAATYFLVEYIGTSYNIPDEVRRTADGTLVPLSGKVERVYFSLDLGSSYFVVRYFDKRSELRRTTDGTLVATLNGSVNGVYFSPDPAATYFVVDYSDGRSELWQGRGNARRLTDLGLGKAGYMFDPKSRWLFIWHTDGRAYQLDLDWLKAMGGDPAVHTPEALVRLACEWPLATGLLGHTALEPYLEGRLPQACR